MSVVTADASIKEPDRHGKTKRFKGLGHYLGDYYYARKNHQTERITTGAAIFR